MFIAGVRVLGSCAAVFSARDAGNENANGVTTANGFAFADGIAAHAWDDADASRQSLARFEGSNAGHGHE
jgi:hypothetical protein